MALLRDLILKKRRTDIGTIIFMVREVESTIKQIAVIRFQRSEDAYVMQRNRLLAGGLSKRQNNETEVSTSICSTGSRSISCRLSAAAVQIVEVSKDTPALFQPMHHSAYFEFVMDGVSKIKMRQN